jgi:hypothetical protein
MTEVFKAKVQRWTKEKDVTDIYIDQMMVYFKMYLSQLR